MSFERTIKTLREQEVRSFVKRIPLAGLGGKKASEVVGPTCLCSPYLKHITYDDDIERTYDASSGGIHVQIPLKTVIPPLNEEYSAADDFPVFFLFGDFYMDELYASCTPPDLGPSGDITIYLRSRDDGEWHGALAWSTEIYGVTSYNLTNVHPNDTWYWEWGPSAYYLNDLFLQLDIFVWTGSTLKFKGLHIDYWLACWRFLGAGSYSSSPIPEGNNIVTVLVKDALSLLPISGATVVLSTWDNSASESLPTGEDGKCTFDALADGGYNLDASKTGYKPNGLSINISGGQPYDFTILLYPEENEYYLLTVYVEDCDTHVPIQDARVTIAKGSSTFSLYTGSDGKATFTVEGGIWSVHAFKTGYSTFDGSVEVTDDMQYDTCLTKAAGSHKLTVHVTDCTSGVAIGGAYVKVADSAGSPVAYGTTDSFGRAYFTLVEAQYNITETKTGYIDTQTHQVYLNSDKVVEACMVGSAGKIDVTVKNQSTNQPMQGVYVALYNSVNSYIRSQPTDVNGNTIFSNLAPGTYTLRASPSGFYQQEVSVTVPVAGTVPVTIYLPPIVETLEIFVKEHTSHEPIVGAVVAIYRSGSYVTASPPTDVNGRTTVSGLSAANYKLICSPSGYQQGECTLYFPTISSITLYLYPI